MSELPQAQVLWMPIPGYVGWYEASSNGDIRRVRPGQGAGKGMGAGNIRKPQRHPGGYLMVKLCRNNNRKYCLVHRLVCAAFHPQPEGATQVNHKDGVRDHNFSENLEWATNRRNHEHAMYENRSVGKLSLGDIAEIRRLYKTKEYSQAQLGVQFGVSQVQIGNVVRGASWELLDNADKPDFTPPPEMDQGPEKWRKVRRYPDYSISNYARLRRDTTGRGTHPGRIRAPQDDRNGYTCVCFTVAGRNKSEKLYRLVAEAFVPPYSGDEVNHKSGVKSDDRACNLEWTTHLRNVQHAFGHNRKEGSVA